MNIEQIEKAWKQHCEEFNTKYKRNIECVITKWAGIYNITNTDNTNLGSDIRYRLSFGCSASSITYHEFNGGIDCLLCPNRYQYPLEEIKLFTTFYEQLMKGESDD